MITDALITLGTTIAQWFLGLLPDQPPSWLLDVSSSLGTVTAAVQSWSVWIPWDAIRIVAVGLFAFWLIVFLLKLLLKAVAFVPFIGGSG